MLIYSRKLYSGLRASFGWLIYVPWFNQKPSPDKSPRFAELFHRKNNSIRKSGIFRDPSTRTVTQIRNIPGAARQGLIKMRIYKLYACLKRYVFKRRLNSFNFSILRMCFPTTEKHRVYQERAGIHHCANTKSSNLKTSIIMKISKLVHCNDHSYSSYILQGHFVAYQGHG